MRFIPCTWFGEFCSCGSLTALHGPAWVLLNWICKELISSLYVATLILLRRGGTYVVAPSDQSFVQILFLLFLHMNHYVKIETPVCQESVFLTLGSLFLHHLHISREGVKQRWKIAFATRMGRVSVSSSSLSQLTHSLRCDL